MENPQKINEMKNAISKLSTYDMEISSFIKKIESGKAYKSGLKSKERQLKDITKQINTILKSINVNVVKSKYKHFPVGKRYTEYTGINSNFFNNIK